MRFSRRVVQQTCGSVDAGGSGEPEVDFPSFSSSESMVNCFVGSGTKIPSPCRTGRRADVIFGYTVVVTRVASAPLSPICVASPNRAVRLG